MHLVLVILTSFWFAMLLNEYRLEFQFALLFHCETISGICKSSLVTLYNQK
jgi:hypothetical protein